MTDLLVAVSKIAFVALLWLFILMVAEVVRKDMFGRRVPVSALARDTAVEAPVSTGPLRFSVTQGEQQGLSIPATETINLGRSADSTFVLQDDYASARHAQIVQRDNGSWMLRDLDSTNGTFVNGRRVSEPIEIAPGDIIRIGRTLMRLEN